jgi:hypothetical protein
LYNYSPGDYLTYNFTGTSCCPLAAADLMIGAGQGYFVQMVDGAAATDVVSFDNSLRSSLFDNTVFYKTSNQTESINVTDLERNRIWLDLVNANSESDRILVGYIEGATNSKDNLYDAGMSFTGSMALYSLIGSDKYMIQGRQLPFNKSDVIPLGIKIVSAGRYSIGIGALDGLFSNTSQNVYLEDKVTGKMHNLKVKPYAFNASVGAFNNRFKLRFKGDDDEEEDDDKQKGSSNIVLFKANQQIEIQSASENITGIMVYDLVGRVLFETNGLHDKNYSLAALPIAQQALVVKITLESGVTVSKQLLY